MARACVAPVVRLCTNMLPWREAPSDHHTSSCGSAGVLPMNRMHRTLSAFVGPLLPDTVRRHQRPSDAAQNTADCDTLCEHLVASGERACGAFMM